MANIKCEVCGKNIRTTGNNFTYNNGIWTHKKCPKHVVLTMDEREDLRELKDRINLLCIQYEKPLNWSLITAQIKRYKEMGYSYKDQLYTLNYIVDKDGTFWGYGRVEKFFSHAMQYKQKYEEYMLKKKNHQQIEPIDIKYKSDYKIDL